VHNSTSRRSKLHWGGRRDATSDFEGVGELLETVGLIGRDKAQQRSAPFLQRWIDLVQVAARIDRYTRRNRSG
jgi:hypothetical protein